MCVPGKALSSVRQKRLSERGCSSRCSESPHQIEGLLDEVNVGGRALSKNEFSA